ncbi:MAG: asparaginase [Gammaproteobacteria bacterium]|jgi:L-asparaginase|nr:asparaginase [Gammaproteobacteria bacterium]MBT6755474.1 asparaginase [Gammaproteobacteria bacterium]MBT7523839.1 asparaginase [Gammaproteobacteria bacterium]MBT7814372.1 asparaginase [Gammaproteobacteria bacterium]MDA9896596.1 asparaginase domain-containing protein [Gammaproteobacteria bacterium]|tara:strand:- start:66 stop:551 length:486 start_codon:yes stop_codon:yes gene_type:complete
MSIVILTTGGTFDKIYFDANSEYSIGEPCISSILDEGNVMSDYRVQSILKKDSLDITHSEREIIKKSVIECEEERIIITHGTDTMVETAKFLEDVKEKTIVLTGAMQPARFKKTDAIFNSGFAYAAALSLENGVYIAMSGQIFNSNNVRKNIDLGKFECKD